MQGRGQPRDQQGGAHDRRGSVAVNVSQFGKSHGAKSRYRYHVDARVLVEGRRGPIVRHRVAARASREWPRGEKRKGSPRVAPPAAGGGKSLSCLESKCWAHTICPLDHHHHRRCRVVPCSRPPPSSSTIASITATTADAIGITITATPSTFTRERRRRYQLSSPFVCLFLTRWLPQSSSSTADCPLVDPPPWSDNATCLRSTTKRLDRLSPLCLAGRCCCLVQERRIDDTWTEKSGNALDSTIPLAALVFRFVHACILLMLRFLLCFSGGGEGVKRTMHELYPLFDSQSRGLGGT